MEPAPGAFAERHIASRAATSGQVPIYKTLTEFGRLQG
jgi:hypothetical protein